MRVLSVVTLEERQRWKSEGHPLNRDGVVIEDIERGSDLKERLLKSQLPDLLVVEEGLLPGRAEHFLSDLRGIAAWKEVPTIILQDASFEGEKFSMPGLFLLTKPASADAYEEIAKRLNLQAPRRYPRRKVMAACAIIAVGKRIECMIRDISISGCKIDYDGELKAGAMLQIAFALKMGYNTVFIKSTAKVVREIKGGYGLAFTTMEPQNRSVIASYIKG
jgi:hypothetical protein